jgi:hypothetical protein
MPLQIRRGNTAEITAITPLIGELIYNTQTQKLHVGNGSTAGGIITSTYSNDDAKDAAAASIAAGTHTNISFSYNSTTKALSATLPSTIAANLKGSLYDSSNQLLLNNATNVFYGNVDVRYGLSTFTTLTVINNVADPNSAIFSTVQAHSAQDARNVSFSRARGTAAAPIKVQSGDELAELVFFGYGDDRYVIGGRITCTVDDNATGNTSMQSKIEFANSNGNGVSVARVVIEKDGLLKANYGITNNTITIDGNRISTIVSNSDIDLDPNGTGAVNFLTSSQTTRGGAGAGQALPATPAVYFRIKVNGVGYLVPAYPLV